MAFIVLRIVVDPYRDPIPHNLWALESAMFGVPCAVALALPAFLRRRRGTKRE